MSSPMEVYTSSNCDDSDDIYAEPSMCCDHQNQLAHYNWDGAPREGLSGRCKQTLGISVQNTRLSSNNDENSTLESGGDDFHLENVPSADPDFEWEQVILKRANRDRCKESNRNASTTHTDTNREVSADVEKGDAGDPSRTKGRKRRMSDKENGGIYTSKKTKKGMDVRIKIHAVKKRSMVKISVKIT